MSLIKALIDAGRCKVYPLYERITILQYLFQRFDSSTMTKYDDLARKHFLKIFTVINKDKGVATVKVSRQVHNTVSDAVGVFKLPIFKINIKFFAW